MKKTTYKKGEGRISREEDHTPYVRREERRKCREEGMDDL
jgi:hypothetical protein